MTTTPYHHGNLREALVEAAIEAVALRGPEDLSLRELARRVGVSHNAAYRHFADRDALVEEVAARGLARLVAAIDLRVRTIEEPDPVTRARRRLMEIGAGYVDFALAEPGLFRLLFTAYPTVPDHKAAADNPFGMLNAALDDLVAVGYLRALDRPGTDVTCWSAVHGFAVLNVEGPLRNLPAKEREAALIGLLLSIDRGLGTGGTWPPIPVERAITRAPRSVGPTG